MSSEERRTKTNFPEQEMRNFQHGKAGIRLPTSQASAQNKIQAVLGILAGKGLCGSGSWDGSRRKGRIDPAQKHEEKAEESLRRLQGWS